MCSTIDNESDLVTEDQLVGPSHSARPKKDCSKCKTVSSAAVFISGNAICKDCFLATSEHKFRAELVKFLKEIGKCSDIHLSNAAKCVILAFSGNVSSMLLLHMLVSERERKRISSELEIIVLFVREPRHSADVCENIEKYLHANCGPFTWQIINLKFADLLRESACLVPDALQQATLLARNRTIADFAKSSNCDAVIFASDQNSLAVKLLRDVSLGYAERAAYTAAIVDRLTCFGVPLARPLRVMATKEVALLFRFFKVNELPVYDFDMQSSTMSVGSVCEDMITAVEGEYPGTASTAFRTGTKLDAEAKPSSERCHICYCCFDPEPNSSKSICYGCHVLGLEKLLPEIDC